MGKWIGIGFGALVVVIIIVVAVVFVSATSAPSAPTPPPLSPSSGPAAPPPPSLPQQLQSVQQAIQQTQQTGQAQDVTLTITEQMANDEVAKAIKSIPPGGDFTIREATIYFRKGVMEMHLSATIAGLSIYPKVKSGVTIQNGMPVSQNLSVELGMIGLPSAINDMIKKTVEDQFTALLKSFGSNLTFKSLQLEDQRMIAVGTTKKT
jgi:hypothetical protein